MAKRDRSPTSVTIVTAVSAAIRAYRDELRRALAEATDEATRRRILAALGVHEAALDALELTVPDPAAAGIDQARDQVGQAQENLRAGVGSPTSSPASTGPAATSAPTRTVRPTETHRPSSR